MIIHDMERKVPIIISASVLFLKLSPGQRPYKDICCL